MVSWNQNTHGFWFRYLDTPSSSEHMTIVGQGELALKLWPKNCHFFVCGHETSFSNDICFVSNVETNPRLEKSTKTYISFDQLRDQGWTTVPGSHKWPVLWIKSFYFEGFTLLQNVFTSSFCSSKMSHTCGSYGSSILQKKMANNEMVVPYHG